MVFVVLEQINLKKHAVILLHCAFSEKTKI